MKKLRLALGLAAAVGGCAETQTLEAKTEQAYIAIADFVVKVNRTCEESRKAVRKALGNFGADKCSETSKALLRRTVRGMVEKCGGDATQSSILMETAKLIQYDCDLNGILPPDSPDCNQALTRFENSAAVEEHGLFDPKQRDCSRLALLRTELEGAQRMCDKASSRLQIQLARFVALQLGCLAEEETDDEAENGENPR